ncbi:hypothetical protein ACF0H5_003517 [Mactra antiquata]
MRPRTSALEKRIKSNARLKRYRKKLVYLGDQIHRWLEIKTMIGAENHVMVAKKLIDFYCSAKGVVLSASQPNNTDGLLPKNRNGTHIDNEYTDLKMECEDSDVKRETINSSFDKNSNPDNHSLSQTINILANKQDNSNLNNHSLSSTKLPVDEESIKTETDSETITSISENAIESAPENVILSWSESEYESDDEYINAIMTEQNVEMIAVPCNSSETGEKRVSTRLQSKGCRPNYASLAKWKAVENDKSSDDSDSDYSDVEWNILVEKCESNRNKKKSKTGKGKRKLAVEDEFDEEEEIENQSIPDENCKSDNTKNNMKIKKARESKLKNNNNTEFIEVKHVTEKTRIKENKPWISIKLEDHSEKYRKESVGSFERKNRGSNIVHEFYTCLLCGKFKINNKAIFEKHMENHVNGLLDCSQCDFVGRTEHEVSVHRKTVHPNKKTKYVCHICGVVMYSQIDRRTHMGKMHNDPQSKCKYCDLRFVSMGSRRNHMRNVHGDLIQFCNICKNCFLTSTAEEFMTHKSTCKPGHQCPVCGKMLISRDGLSYHIKFSHMNARKHQCHICQYAAKSLQRLREHILTHTSSHPYSCDQCSFTCVQACQLTSHQRTHTGDKPYKCTQCNFAAAWNVQLKDHVKVHFMNTAVLCEPCNILFKNDKARKMHEKKDH